MQAGRRKPISSTLILIAITTTSMLLLFIFCYSFVFTHHTAHITPTHSQRSPLFRGPAAETFSNPAQVGPVDTLHVKPKGRSRSKDKIAYVFAGSIRSFTCPRVHWSLRWNLIDAMGGEAYSFVRTSVEDNANVRTGKGTIWSPQYDNSALNATLSILSPRKVEYFSLSTQLDEMRKRFPSMIHRVFQENDLRRYSMFYHRCMAFQMVLDYEKENNMRFDWVALTRLDAAWLEPIVPIEMFSKDRVWLTETGYVPFNDQFMLIPRQYADYLYNLDTKVDPAVYCLGGPDVETWKCRREKLEKKYPHDPEFVNATLSYCCGDNTETGANTLGYSETIHLRHLREGKIPVGFARLPVYITRLNKKGQCLPECARLYHTFKMFVTGGLEFTYPYMAPPNAIDTRMIALPDTNLAICVIVNDDAFSPWSPISAQDFHKLTIQPNSPYRVNYRENLYNQVPSLHPSLAYDPTLVSPWRIRPQYLLDRCLTANFSNRTLVWSECRTHLKLKGGRRHHPGQSWFLHVRPHDVTLLQPLLLRDLEYPGLLPPQQHLPNLTQIYMPMREPRFFELIPRLYCLTVRENAIIGLKGNNRTVDFLPCVKDYQSNPRQFFHTVQGLTQGTSAPSTLGMLVMAAAPQYCLVRDNEDSKVKDIADPTKIEVELCHVAPPARKYFEFEVLM